MLLPPSIDIFNDDCVRELELHNLRQFLFENTVGISNASGHQSQASSVHLMDIFMKGEGNEQDIGPFDRELLEPLQNLPPGRLPGVNFDAIALSAPSTIFTSSTVISSGNSPKRRKIDNSQQNVTIQHF